MKTPEEIKKVLEMCRVGADCALCPYSLAECGESQLEADALAYIQQLEAALEVLRGDCDYCKREGMHEYCSNCFHCEAADTTWHDLTDNWELWERPPEV